jgi:hypothetical protein
MPNECLEEIIESNSPAVLVLRGYGGFAFACNKRVGNSIGGH